MCLFFLAGGKVVSIGIDACAHESSCSVGFCVNEVQVLPTYTLVTDENGIVPPAKSAKTFVSMDVRTFPSCRSEPATIESCSENANKCLNGGTCVNILPTGYRCICLDGYDGPQCQKTTRYVKNDGYFWLKPISYFFAGEISFEFSTKEESGLIFFHGPISKCKEFCFVSELQFLNDQFLFHFLSHSKSRKHGLRFCANIVNAVNHS